MSTNAGKIWNYFKGKGLTEQGVAGLMGNLEAESGLNPKNLENSKESALGYGDDSYTNAVDNGSYSLSKFKGDSAGYGIAQWTWKTRKEKLYKYAKSKGSSIGSLNMQMDFLYKELSEDYSGVLKFLKQTTSVRDASNKVLTDFERPRDQSQKVKDGRYNKSKAFYDKFKGTNGDDSDDAPSGPVKILLIGNSYTYYNGIGQILSLLCKAKSIEAVVVRATNGSETSLSLLKKTLDYKCWVDGKVIKNGTGTAKLGTVIDIDFKGLSRGGSWDFVISQNGATDNEDTIYKGDIKMFEYIVDKKKALASSKNFILHATQYGGSLASKYVDVHKKAANEKICSVIDSRGLYGKYEDVFEGSKWINELTIRDRANHQSARGAYVYACAIFAKLFGSDLFPEKEKDECIPVYNSEGGTAHSFIKDRWHAATAYASSKGNKIPKSVATKLQFLVRKYAVKYVGGKLYRGSSSTTLTSATVDLADIVDLSTIYQYVITLDRNTKSKVDIKAIQSVLNMPAVMVEAGYLFDANHNQVSDFVNPKLKSQLTPFAEAKMPWALFMISRARSQKEALLELNQLYFVANKWTPELGIWIVPEWSGNTKSINDGIMETMYTKLVQFGFKSKIGLYATKKQIETITWAAHCDRWFLWWVNHTKVEEYKDEVITPEFFMLNDGTNNPQPVKLIVKESDLQPDTTWKAAQTKNGVSVGYYNSQSDMVVVGDNRCIQMYNKKLKSSYVAVWGGHYGYSTYTIDTYLNVQKIKGCIKNINEAKKTARVFLVPTPNDYRGAGSPDVSIEVIVRVAQELYEYAEEKAYKVKIYCCSLIGLKDGWSVDRFNAAMKKLGSNSKQYNYLDINPGDIKYLSDGINFTDATLTNVFNVMLSKK